jgi:hypothetical protein
MRLRARGSCRTGLQPLRCYRAARVSRRSFGKSCIYLASLLLAAACLSLRAAGPPAFRVVGAEPGPWAEIFGAVGIQSGGASQPNGIFVLGNGEATAGADWAARVSSGAYLILEGDSETGRRFGFRPTAKRVRAVSVEDLRYPRLDIVWERPAEIPVVDLPSETHVFARERWSGAPLMAGFRRGAGAVLWLALSPGAQGYERFPYLLHALSELGLSPPFRSRRLWAFFDSSYRARVDPDYLADRWRQTGICGLHIASWHFFEPDPLRDDYLRRLIESCHRRGILTYAWLELPHVSEKFWEEHPAWREKTALLEDANLDWRKLVNLQNEECFQAVAKGVRSLLDRFDWDGANLAELYFESLQGHTNPSRFTPMNEDVRRAFSRQAGFDPVELFNKSSERHWSRNAAGLRKFLDFRAELARGLQAQWLAELESVRRSKPDLDLVLTHVDDRLDPGMRDAIGADSASVLPLLDRYSFTFLVEDPATVWHLGPERYDALAGKYNALTAHRDRLAIDINIVERYQDVYPTRQQTGTELLQLVARASRVFPRVALYFENSILAADVPWLASAAAVVKRYEREGTQLVVDSPNGVGIEWQEAALVDGRLWPAADGETLWVPAGRHSVGPAPRSPAVRLLDLTGELTGADSLAGGLEFSYRSSARAFAVIDKRPHRVEIDGTAAQPRVLDTVSGFTLSLPRGQHLVRIYAE